MNAYIPIFVSITGGIVAVLIYLIDVKLFDVSSIFEALLLGLIAGASSTGTNQIIKKVKKQGLMLSLVQWIMRK